MLANAHGEGVRVGSSVNLSLLTADWDWKTRGEVVEVRSMYVCRYLTYFPLLLYFKGPTRVFCTISLYLFIFFSGDTRA